MKAGAHLEQACNASAHNCTPPIGLGDAAQDLEQCRVSRAVPPDNAEHLAALDLKGHIVQGPELLDLIALDDLPTANEIEALASEISRLARDDVAQHGIGLALARPMANEVALREVLNCDGDVGHCVQ